MSKPMITLLTSAFLLAACAAAGATDLAQARVAPAHAVSTSASSAHCDISVTRTRGGAALEASAFSARDFEGDYSLSIIKSGANSSDIRQDGPVSLHAGERAALAGNEISIGRGERVRAELVLSDARGEVCSDEARL